MKFYLAAPFFKPEQKETLERIEKLAIALDMHCFSPREVFVCPPDANQETRQKTFQGNLDGIMYADFILARIDDFDPGTIWEMGFAFAYRGAGAKKIYAFTTVPGRGLNLMLACGVDGFLVGMDAVDTFLQDMASGAGDREAKKWLGSIQ